MVRFLNNVKTVVLLGMMSGLVLAAGWLLGGGGTAGLTLALIVCGVMNFVALFFSDKIAIAAMRGQEVDAKSAPDLVPMVERLAKNAGLPMPKVYVCPQEAPNAFATGRSPSKAAVAVTNGAMRLLDYQELEGVIGHELAHIKNRDTLTSTIAATIAGALQWLGYMFLFGGGNRDNPMAMIGMLVMIIAAPIAAMVIQMAISRSREYVADADGAEIAGSPHGLVNALRKLEAYGKRIPLQNEMPAQNHMFIIKPLSGRRSGLSELFSTHPPTAKRISKLLENR
ncbi:MAG: zinc metalloprotease HtpX [Planctomycetota bacterium]